MEVLENYFVWKESDKCLKFISFDDITCQLNHNVQQIEFDDSSIKTVMKSPIKNDIIILSDKNEISMIKLELNKKDNTTKISERCSSSNGPKVDKVQK